MEMAGAMRLERFWPMTPTEFMARFRGFAMSKGATKKAKPPTRAEAEEWKAKAARGEKF